MTDLPRTFIIASGAYVDPELAAEFGRIPPAFLPIGNRRLFERQRALIGPDVGIVLLSLPDSFDPDESDTACMDALGITAVRVPDGLSLGESIVFVINVAAAAGGEVAILHGDTLLYGVPFGGVDCVSVDYEPPPEYQWAFATTDGERVREIHAERTDGDCAALTGFFCFSSAACLVQAITRSGGDFIAGLQRYSQLNVVRAVVAERWLDCGHTTTYHQSRRRLTTEREFNQLSVTRRVVRKSGRMSEKLEAEARWFESMPPEMRIFAPAYLGADCGELDVAGCKEFSYRTEYLYLPTLSDLFVFGRLPERTWSGVFEACDEFLTACKFHRVSADCEFLDFSYSDRTFRRLERYFGQEGIDGTDPCRYGGKWLPSLVEIVERSAAQIPPLAQSEWTFSHGDFCFSNTFYDARARVVRVVDPRGMTAAGVRTIYGDIRYDIGKMYHSVVGMYDHILAGNYVLTSRSLVDVSLQLPRSNRLDAICAIFLERKFGGLTPSEAAAPALAVLLFLSMLPLHSDDRRRQRALLANALRLFAKLDMT